MKKVIGFRPTQAHTKQLQLIQKRLQANNTSATLRLLIEHFDEKKINQLTALLSEIKEINKKNSIQIIKFNKLGSNLNQIMRVINHKLLLDSFSEEDLNKLKIAINEIKLTLKKIINHQSSLKIEKLK